MGKSYSNKALPAGTILREWRLEEVLGVGGFGIVYKGCGIYFNELVAIKEYFPSSLSERKDGDTVVPIDSDAEEVHALGLKKFVEEAKLLWNLSTPTRHPNIVSVRSLFEVHGTAYMVMDFEDGVSLSKMLKDGQRFNESSLMGLIGPIAQGLERAHRVGVLHRDIKPANILVNEDGRPVLIDFGSARFVSGDATSTTVTFHTPPYAAIEQYVKTYAQGPWTDIYALGVVLYECVTGEKPPEVLERMHGGLGKALSDGEWPGYSRAFMRAVDAAMTIRPSDRPQSISEWLAQFDEPEEAPVITKPEAEDDEEATRFVAYQTLSEKIIPVAPPPPGFDEVQHVETPVPDSIDEVEFKLAGQDTKGSKNGNGAGAAAAEPAAIPEPTPRPESAPPPAQAKPAGAKPPAPGRKLLFVGAPIAAAVLLAGGWYLVGRDKAGTPAGPGAATVVDNATAGAVALDGVGPGGLAGAVQSLLADARKAGAPANAVRDLAEAEKKLTGLAAGSQKLTGAAATASTSEQGGLAKAASASFATMLVRDAQARTQRLKRDLPWTEPGQADAQTDPNRQKIAVELGQARSRLLAAAAAATSATDPNLAVAQARQALAASGRFNATYFRAFRSDPAAQAKLTEPLAAPGGDDLAGGADAVQPDKAAGASPAKLVQFNAIVATARDVAANVIKISRSAQAASNNSDEADVRARSQQQNLNTAQQYLSYLDNLAASMRGAKNDPEADRLIAQADQTRRYLMVLLSRSSALAR